MGKTKEKRKTRIQTCEHAVPAKKYIALSQIQGNEFKENSLCLKIQLSGFNQVNLKAKNLLPFITKQEK